ncbi:TIGR02594 family protein [Astrobacterium formosum]|uniref:TIGR02594 family protein n=1 Tax=Astrobacterium formosum TaxID=3069710 RepID=UPI003F4F8E4A
MRHAKAKRLRGRPQAQSQIDNWMATSADMPAYAYEPAAQTSSERINRGHQRANAPTRRRLAAAPDMSGGGGGLVEEARRWLGTNPTNRSSLWCAAFMNFVLQRAGHEGTGSNLAKSFASLGRRVSGPQVGAIAVMSRRGGGHVGVVSGIDEAGNPIIISGNSRGRKVAEHAYPRGRIYAYVMP